MRHWKQLSLGVALAAVLGSCGNTQKADLTHFPENADPAIIGHRVAERFLEQPHSQYGSPLRANEPRTQITYPDVCAWLGGLWFAETTRDTTLLAQLETRFQPLFTTDAHLQPVPNHVDNNVFGALALELYLQTKDKRYYDLGMMYANTQWTLPAEHTAQEKAWADNGYSWQTRIWLDDMFMITAVQAQAYRVTGDRQYIDRAAREMVLYLDSIQLGNGLFYHSPEAPFCWGRGNGWMAVGMAELLRFLPDDNPDRPVIMQNYLTMMRTLKACQNENGLWLQLLDDPSQWEETSGSGMFTYAMIVGVKKGWLDPEKYTEVARKGWLGLVSYIDDKADVKNVCEGTPIGYTADYYRDRLPLTGDVHGQAPVLWCAYALLADDL